MRNPFSDSQSLRFGVFELDLHAGELRKQGVKIKLQYQPFQILALLLEHPGRVVTREDLRSRLWPSDTFVDFDHSLNKAINKLREALADSPENPQFIETIPRRGYRFLESLETTTPDASIAVLPFLNLSANAENELFADGMTEEIISTLMQIKRAGTNAELRNCTGSGHARQQRHADRERTRAFGRAPASARARILTSCRRTVCRPGSLESCNAPPPEEGTSQAGMGCGINRGCCYPACRLRRPQPDVDSYSASAELQCHSYRHFRRAATFRDSIRSRELTEVWLGDDHRHGDRQWHAHWSKDQVAF